MSTSTIVGVDDASQDTDSISSEMVPQIVLRPVVIMHSDGTSETVYIQNTALDPAVAKEHARNKKLHRQLSMIYIAIGTVALSLTAVATIIHLRKSHG